ncbi:MAG: AAA family ATPase [Gammaproteobacteria bacterium]|nr:AAA family ATPase [Gammaproteobacteria bacterium]
MARRSFLNLTHNPFEAPREGFYPGADRKTHLDHLRHLSQWSRRILVVSGAFGIGKSTLFQELSNNIEPKIKAARISGSVVTSEREVLVALAQGFGIAVDDDMQVADIAILLQRYTQEQETDGQICMAMLDDAHLLDAGAIAKLISIVGQCPVRLVLFAEASIIGNVTRAAKQNEMEWFEIRLTGFPKVEVRHYLEWRLVQAQHRGRLPFTNEQIDVIATRSAGNPSVIDRVASEMMADMELGQMRNKTGVFPTRHAVLALMLVVLVGLTYLLVQPEHVVPDDTVILSDADKLRSTTLQETQLALPEQEISTDNGESKPLEVLHHEAVTTETSPKPVSETDPSEAIEAAAIKTEAVDLEAQALETTEVVEPAVTEIEVAEIEVAEIEVRVEQPAQPTWNETVGFNSAQWILRQAGDRFTLQLMTLSKAEGVTRFISAQDDPSEFAVYRVRGGDRYLYVITYGVFSTRGAAQQAADQLQDRLDGAKPWIRALKFVHNTIRGTPQD